MTMTTSVAATELAKLGKCEAMIKNHVRRTSAPAKWSRSSQRTESMLRGELAHYRYEEAALRFMSSTAKAKRQIYHLVFSATIAAGILTLLAIWMG